MIRDSVQAIRSAGVALRRKAGGADQSVEEYILTVGVERLLPHPPMDNQGWWGTRVGYALPAPTLVSYTTAGPSGYQSSLSVSKPTVINGDKLCICVAATRFGDGNAQNSSISGFTSRASSGSGYTRIEWFDRTIDGSEGSSFSVTGTTFDYFSAFVIVVRGGVYDGSGSDGSAGGFDGNHKLPSVTTSANDSLLFGVLRGWTDPAGAPSGWTLLNGPLDTAGYAYSKSQAVAGASGASTIAPQDTDRWAALTVAYKPG